MHENIEEYLSVPSVDRFYKLLGDDEAVGEELVVWVDWRAAEDEMVADFESLLKTGAISSEFLDSNNEHGFDFFIQYKDKRKRVPFVTLGTENRQEAIVTLNELLEPDYEIRFCVDSAGNDTLAYIPLSCADWRSLEEKFTQEKVRRHFYPINAESPNMFTDYVHPITFRDGKMVVHDPSKRGLWNFICSLFCGR